MAIDKRLKIYDDQGHDVDYDIMADDVKFLPDGKDLPTKLAEMEDAIEDAAEGGGYTPPQGGIPKTDLAPAVQTSLGKADTALQATDKAQLQSAINAVQTALNNLMNGQNVTDAIDTFNEVTAFLNGIDTSDPTLKNQLLALNNAISALQTSLAAKANDADVVKGIKDSNGNTLQKSNGIVTLPESQGGLTKEDISVETQGDGTVEINVKDDTYTVNLNHTHPGMAKLEKFVASNPPASMANDTIYAKVDNLTTPTEIQSLFLFGCEFVGGGIPDTGEPMISSPSNGSTINLGVNEGSGVSKTITVKGKNLTGDLTVAVSTGLTVTYGQSTGQSSVTIPMAQALLGAQVTIAYSGSGSVVDGTLLISQGNDILSSVALHVGETVPDGYTLLEYVDNAAAGILTNVPVAVSASPFVGSKWELDIELTSPPSGATIVVASDNNTAHWFGAMTDGKFGVGATADGWTFPDTGRNVFEVEFVSKGVKATCNGTTKTRTNPSNLEHPSGLNVALLGNMNGTNPTVLYYGKIYSIKCTSGGAFNGVPAKRNSDNKKGLYDITNGIFYPLTT